MSPREKTDEPGADILPDTPMPTAEPGKLPERESENIEEEGDPLGDNFA